MKAVVFYGVGDIQLDDVAEPKIEHPRMPLCGSRSREPLMSALDADKAFDQRKPGWIKVELETNGHGETPKPRFEVEDVAR